jgi:hypothetical protein
MLIDGILDIGKIVVNPQRILLMNLYSNVIFKTVISNYMRKQKYDALKKRNKPPYVPLTIQEKFMIPPSKTYKLNVYPKTNFNDIDVINKLNAILETKLETKFAITGGSSTKYNFLNDIIKDVNKLKRIKKQKTLKKRIGKIKNKHELENIINAKIKKYIKKYLEKKEKQLEELEMKIIKAKKSLTQQQQQQYYLFNKKEYKNKITRDLNSKINKKINKFNNVKIIKSNKHKKNNTRKKY